MSTDLKTDKYSALPSNRLVLCNIPFYITSLTVYNKYGILCLEQEEQTETDNEDFFTVSYNGIDYTECLYELEWLEIPGAVQETWIERDDGTVYYKNAFKVFFRVPVGYDGNTVSIINLEAREKLKASNYSVDGCLCGKMKIQSSFG